MAKGEITSWGSLPHKSQLFVLALCRFAEPLSNTSIFSYLFYLLQSFDTSLSAAQIARQAGFVVTAFALGQFFTGTLWGSLSDSIGRKKVLMIGLSGSVATTLMIGFSVNLWMVIAARLACGLMNGNVGILRTMIAEIVVEKKHQSRAFLIMPMCFNIGAVIGPTIGGLLANPTAADAALSWLVGKDSVLGGKSGTLWLIRFPYALPNVVSAMFLSSSLLACWLFLQETHPVKAGQPDLGITTGQSLTRAFRRLFKLEQSRPEDYIPLAVHGDAESSDPRSTSVDIARRDSEQTLFEAGDNDVTKPPRKTSSEQAFARADVVGQATMHGPASSPTSLVAQRPSRSKYSQILTPNVILTLISFMLCPLHNATFMQLWPIYLSTPRSPGPYSLPFEFSGGLGLSTSSVGYAISVLGVVGVFLQILVFPGVQQRFGTMLCYRASLWIFPISYALIPYLSILPSRTADYASGPVVWSAMIGLLLLQVWARTFALPSTVILLNNSAPDRQCLGTIHGLGSSLASLSRVVGPLSGAFLFGRGEDIGMVGLVWWTLAGVATFGAIFSMFIQEGPGFEKEEGGPSTR